jgi:tetratricopeptide (TPR) repeat protein
VFQVPDSQEFLNADTRQLTADAIALNNKVDAASEAKGSQAPVTVADLQGGKAKLVVPTAGPASDRQRAQQANDRGLQLYREKQYDEAAAQFTEALKLRPDFAQAANNLGFVYYRQQRYAEAARWLENTLKIDPRARWPISTWAMPTSTPATRPRPSRPTPPTWRCSRRAVARPRRARSWRSSEP